MMLQERVANAPFSLSGQKYEHISTEFKKLLSRVYNKVQKDNHSDRPSNLSPYQRCCNFLKRPKLPGTYSSFKRKSSRPGDKLNSRVSLTEITPQKEKGEQQVKLHHVRGSLVTPQKTQDKSLFSKKITDYNQLLVAKQFLFEEMPKKRKSNNLAKQAQRLKTQGTEIPLQRQSLYQFTVGQQPQQIRSRRLHRKAPTFIRTHGRFGTQNLEPKQQQEPTHQFTPWQTEPFDGVPPLMRNK